MSKIASKIMNFSPNEGLSYGDLNDVQKAMTQRAWEWPEFSNVIATQRFIDGVPSYGGSFGNTTTQAKLVFTKGAGLFLLNSGFVVSVYPGFAGIFSGSTGAVEFGLSSPTPSMRWAAVSVLEALPAVSNPGGALEQYSLIQAKITDATTDSQSRHFKSAATGAKSSAATNKRRALSLTFTIKDGIAAALGTATIPALDAGESLVGYTRQTAAGIQEVYDCTVPFGPMKERVYFAREMYRSAGTLSINEHINTFTGACMHEVNLGGDPRERIVGVDVLHTMNGASANIKFWRAQGTAVVDLATLGFPAAVGGTDFTADGTQRTATLNLMGAPVASGGIIRPPVWAGGYTFKHDGGFVTLSNETLVLQVYSNDGAPRTVQGIRVYSVTA